MTQTWIGSIVGMAVVGGLLVAAGPAAGQETMDALCAQREGCAVRAVFDAGAGYDGRPLRVAALTLPSPDDVVACRPDAEEYWLVPDGAKPVRVLALCNDGYGASGIGEDVVTVTENRLVHQQVGGSAWRWSTTRTLQLDPLQVVAEQRSGEWAIGPNWWHEDWDWPSLSGEAEWWAPACGDSRDLMREPADGYRYSPIPMVQPADLPADIGSADLGSCATQFDQGRPGHVIWGDAGDVFAGGGWMRVLMVSPGDLIVTVRQVNPAAGARSWLHDDHLELWLAPYQSYFDHCLEDGDDLQQWAIRLTDAEVISAFGDPTDPPVVRSHSIRPESTDPQTVIVTTRLGLPDWADAVTVVYSRGDGDERQVWMAATSALAYGVGATVGQARTLPAGSLACVVRDGWLDLVDTGLHAVTEHR